MMRSHLVAIAVLLVSMTLAGCAQIGSAPTATPRAPAAQITITRPVPGVTIASPVLVGGVVSRLPASGLLTYQVYDSRNIMVGTGTIPIRAAGEDALRFETQVVYAGAQAGPGKILVVDIAADNASVQASAELPVILSGPGGAVTLPSQVAGAGTLVPGVLTPLPGMATPIPIYPAPLPPAAGATALPGMATPLPALVSPTPVVIGAAPTQQLPAGAQQIIFESPAPGTLVGSPVLISGHTTRYPFQGNLSYTIRDAAQQIVGQGLIGVDGPESGPGAFRVELDFNPPTQVGALSIELADEDAVSGTVVASATLVVSFGTQIGVIPTSPPFTPPMVASPTAAIPASTAQAIVFESPPANAVVGNPIVLIGRVTQPPASGRLYYRVSDAAATLLGEGTFTIGNDATRPLAFNTTIPFTLPAHDGPVAIEITDRDATNVVVGRSTLVVNVDVPEAYPRP